MDTWFLGLALGGRPWRGRKAANSASLKGGLSASASAAGKRRYSIDKVVKPIPMRVTV
ncbi:hypothetical protein V0R37_13330 [Pollutimonas sp. H1-120]|uniref:hypothetical protein n=1 Tax=Pollutimonas sp. H1-120 TaxID=3148824 RepID=UPI003B518062